MTPMASHDPELVRFYEDAEQAYLRSLPPEHFMEATDHARQREITLESFAVIQVARPDVQCFDELARLRAELARAKGPAEPGG